MPKLDLLSQVKTRTGTQDIGAVSLTVKDIPIGEISIKGNVRQEYKGIDELKDSIKTHGLLQPITVYRDGEGYAVKTGHRRYIACKDLYAEHPERFHSIRCIISDAENITAIQIIENVQREGLTAIDLYNGLKELKGQGLTLKQIADVIGKQESTVKKWYTAINDIDRDADIKKTIEGYAGVTMDDIQETKAIKDKGKRLDLLKEKGKGTITRQVLREKVKTMKPAERTGQAIAEHIKEQEGGTVELNADMNELFIEMFFPDKVTYRLIAGELKAVFTKHKIKYRKGIK